MVALSVIDEGTQVLRSSFWVEPLNDASGRVAYCWKRESWDRKGHGQPTLRWHHVHRIVETPLFLGNNGTQGKRPATLDSYRPLPDEDLDFFYDPAQSVNQSSSYSAIFEPTSLRPVGSVSPNNQKWDVLNEIQFWCRGCRLQQARGLFEGEEIRKTNPSSNNPSKLEPRDRDPRLAFQQPPPYVGVWNHSNLKSQPPQGAYIATGCRGQWKLAESVSDQEYNRLLQMSISREIRHRHQNEEHQKSVLDPSYPRQFVYQGDELRAIAYHHPIVGSWVKRVKLTEEGEPIEAFYNDAPPLAANFQMTDFSQPTKSWLDLASERQQQRLRS